MLEVGLYSSHLLHEERSLVERGIQRFGLFYGFETEGRVQRESLSVYRSNHAFLEHNIMLISRNYSFVRINDTQHDISLLIKTYKEVG